MSWVTDENNQEKWTEDQPTVLEQQVAPKKPSSGKLILVGAALAVLALGIFFFGRKKKGS